MLCKHWDAEKNEPDEVLKDFLEKKAESVRERIKSATGLDIRPICYCAGYKEDGKDQCKLYNLTKLLYYIVNSIPRDKRLALADNINPDKDNWIFDDGEEDYKSGIKRGFLDTIWDGISDGAETGSEIGQTILGIPGYIDRSCSRSSRRILFRNFWIKYTIGQLYVWYLCYNYMRYGKETDI